MTQEEKKDPQDVKQEEQPSSEGPTEQKDSEKPKEGDTSPEEKERLGEKADELLGQKRKILVEKDRFDDRNNKAKIFETHEPLLKKVLEKPDLVEELLAKHDGDDIASRVTRLEQERRETKERELKQAMVNALGRWPDLEKDWSDMRPTFESLSKRHSPEEALSRAYIALHPEAAAEEAERLARAAGNREGAFSMGSGYSPNPVKMSEKVELTDYDKRNASMLGKTPEEYAKVLSKWDSYGKEHGWDKF